MPAARTFARATALAVAVVLAAMLAPFGIAPAHADDGDRPVVLVGVPGLAWSDADQLGDLLAADELGVGSLVVRSTQAVACPVDGWLSISTGNRASGPGSSDSDCAAPTDPADGVVPGWDTYLELAASRSFEAEPGLLGDELAAASVPATAIGPGAAVALATSAGTVASYQAYQPSGSAAAVADALADSDLVVVDLGDQLAPTGSPERPATVETVAAQIAALVEGADGSGRDPVVVISGVSDTAGDTEAALRLFAVLGQETGEISSSSTRQAGYLLATDQHATILDLLGIDPGATSSIGTPMALTPGGDAGGLVDAARDRQLHADGQLPLIAPFYLVLVLLNLMLYAAVALGLRRTSVVRRVAGHREPLLRSLRVVALGIAAVPVSSDLTNLLPWWRTDPPVVGLLVGTVLIAAAIVALALRGPWRHQLLGPAAVVAGITAAALGIDVVTGATMQVSAVMGIPTLVAGRFYGMNNTSFALFTASVILLTTALANPLVQRGQRGRAAALTVVIGLAAIVIDGAPFWGADFGGPPALLVAFGLLALLAGGIRLTVKRVVLIVLGAAVATMAIAFLDWLRPPQSRTHLGRFFADVLDGDLWPVITRKLDQNLTILLGNRPLTILAICGVLLVVLVLIRPLKETITSPDGGEYAWLSGGAPISAMARETPLLGPGLIALAVAAGIGFAVNDSGIAIPALAVALAVPLLLASCATWMLAVPTVVEGGSVPGGPAAAQAPR